MKLEDAISKMVPLLRGRASLHDTADALGADDTTTRGLGVYEEIARMARTGLLESMFPHSYEATLRELGRARWEAIVEQFFEEHPERHYLRRLNAGAFVGFARELSDLPTWVVELVDFEWAEWRAERNDAPTSREPGLRQAPSLELRRYQHDLVTWLDTQEKLGAPERRAIDCAFWQDATGQSFRCSLSPELFAALGAVRGSEPADAARVLELRDAEILVGEP